MEPGFKRRHAASGTSLFNTRPSVRKEISVVLFNPRRALPSLITAVMGVPSPPFTDPVPGALQTIFHLVLQTEVDAIVAAT